MNWLRNKFLLLLIMAGLLAAYFYLNANKVIYTKEVLKQIAAGKKLATVTLSLEDKEFVRIQLPTSDFFSSDNRHQVTFHRLERARFQELHRNIKRIQVYGEEGKLRVDIKDTGNAIIITMPGKKLYLVEENDLRTIAKVLEREEKQRIGIVQCYGIEFCRALHLSGVGWGNLQGPFLNTERQIMIRAMPRGRWLYGPKTEFNIRSKVNGRLLMELNLMGIFEDQQFRVKGKITAVRHISISPPQIIIGDKRFFPKRILLEMPLQRGANKIAIEHSRWWHGNSPDKRPLAAYLVNVKIKGKAIFD